MWPAAFLSILITITTLFSIEFNHERLMMQKSVNDNADVVSFLAYRQAAIAYLNNNPLLTGSITNTQMTPYVPVGYTDPGHWQNLIDSGKLYVYTTHNLNLDLLNDRLYRSFLVGKKAGGTLISLSGYNTSIPLPASLPDNAIIIVGS